MVAGCTPPPDLRDQVAPVDTSAAWPSLLSFDALQQSTGIAGQNDTEFSTGTADLAARAAALRARAGRLSQPILDAATRRRLQAAIARHR